MAKILLVDDEPMVRHTMRTVLERAGHQVDEAEDGNACLRAVSASAPDLILMDIIMPDREGIETIRDLRAAGFAAPIIAMSGGGRTGVLLFLEAAKLMGAERTLGKPVKSAELVAAVSDCLRPLAA